MKGAKKKVLFQPSTGRVTRATTRGENHQPRSASAPRLGDSPERAPWERAQNQPGQVDTLSEENNLDQYTEMEGAAGGENQPVGPSKGRSSMLPQFQKHEALEAEQRNAAWYERPDRSCESKNNRIAVSDIQETRTEGTAFAARTVPNPTDSFLRYQETPPLEPVTQDMLNSQMHRLRTPRRVDTPSHRQFRRTARESSHQLHPEIDRNSSFQGPRPKDVRLDRWNLKFDGSGRGMTVESFLFRVDGLQELYDLSRQQVFREFHLLLAGAATT